MVFSWAPSVFTKKLVTSPIRIWERKERQRETTNILVKQKAKTVWLRTDQLHWISCQLNMVRSKIIHECSSLPCNDYIFLRSACFRFISPFGWFYAALVNPNINTSHSLSSVGNCRPQCLMDLLSLHFSFFSVHIYCSSIKPWLHFD